MMMARAFCQLKSVRDVAEYWLTTYPEHAITGLLPIALGKPIKEQQDARMTLRYWSIMVISRYLKNCQSLPTT